MIRMIKGIGIPINQSKIGIAVSPLSLPRVPGPVAQSAAFGGRQTGAERSQQHGCSEPECESCRSLARSVGVGLRLCHHVVDALFGIGLAHACSSGNDLGNVVAIWPFQLSAI